MDADAALKISGTVVVFTQLLKWAGVNDRYGPYMVIIISGLLVLFWGWSASSFSRETAFSFFMAWGNIAAAAAGIFGFTRSFPSSLVATKAPPAGAGAELTGKMK